MRKLDRELGLFSVCTIACGAMLSGLFVLPGHAADIGGSSVHLAFLLAGLLFIPAALSKAEMATALPEAGGDYIFIDRAFGPMVSTITGMGTWLALMLKSAFALVGLSAYLFLIVDLPASYLIYFACAVGFFLLVLNSLGVKKTGQFQSFLVVATFLVLLLYVERGAVNVRPENFEAMFGTGALGFISATAFVFVSYAGVTKVASAAEEVKNPSVNIPWGMLLSLIIMILIYASVVYVVVGVVPVEQLGSNAGIYKNAPLSQAALEFMGWWGELLVSSIAVLALAAMANAGLLASSRYPLAMSRYKQLPEVFSSIHRRFGTPVLSVVVTGSAIILSIVFLPVIQLAKLASAFLLLVFALVHLSLIVFRESEIEWYQPEFTSPFYPYIQFIGVASSFLLIGFMGWLTIIGSLALVGVGFIWYLVYARKRADRLGAFFKQREGDEELQEEERELFEETRSRSPSGLYKDSVIVPFFELDEVDLEVERRMRLAAALCDPDEILDVVHFYEVPEQIFLSNAEVDEEIERAFEERIDMLRGKVDNEIHFDEVITHNSRRALRNYAEEENPHWVVLEWMEPSNWGGLIGQSKWWLEDFPCDTFFLLDRGRQDFEDIIVLTEPGPFDGEVVYAADHITCYSGGSLTFLNPLAGGEEARTFMESYQRELSGLCEQPSRAELIPAEEWEESVLERCKEADLLLMGGLTDDTFEGFSARSYEERFVEQADCSVGRIRSAMKEPISVLANRDEAGTDVYELVKNHGEVLRSGAPDQGELYRELAGSLHEWTGVETEDLERAFRAREEEHGLTVRHGVAFPNATVSGVNEPLIRIVLLDDPVRFGESGDEAQICISVLGSDGDQPMIRTILGALEELFTSPTARQKLIESEQPEEARQNLLGMLRKKPERRPVSQ